MKTATRLDLCDAFCTEDNYEDEDVNFAPTRTRSSLYSIRTINFYELFKIIIIICSSIEL